MARKKGSAAPPAVIKSSDRFPVSSSDASRVLTLLAVIAAVATVALTGGAFWLSYEHLHDVAAAQGLQHSPARAWAWPGTVDLFIVIGEVLILRASLMRRIDWWAIALAVAGSLGSIALNVAGVGAGAEPMDYIVAAVPPVAALLAFGALMRQVHEAIARRVATPGVAVQRTPVAAICAAPLRPVFRWADAVPAGVRLLPLVAAGATPVAVPPQGRGEMLTTSEVAERLNVSPNTVRSYKHRGTLTPVAADPGGGHLFDARDVEKLRGTP
ncbi:hypothetical protein DMA15_03785 [Streptomyces sp. WAC 01529]|uniref:DUF2637 domain-containing protein n=1 Tax=Streptomyces sp. WAC 01529 TaxID=2203205 RepID=UPI000F6E4572|nr:DUF2637 domain-containing protein [Streptomyces sp. WAC 01529]AZM51814.1 hypothetical protein DMA15_03785 [Streptomyces sp. WAC 01529]